MLEVWKMSRSGGSLGKSIAFPLSKIEEEEFPALLTTLSTLQQDTQANIYHGVNPRLKSFDDDLAADKASAGKSLEHVASLTSLFLDLDFVEAKDLKGDEKYRLASTKDKTNILKFLRSQGATVVFSGGGAHGYWNLKKPVEFERSREGVKEKEHIIREFQIDMSSKIPKDLWNAIVHKEVEGKFIPDPTHDLRRVARMPGSINQKNGEECVCLHLGEKELNWTILAKKYKDKKTPRKTVTEKADPKGLRNQVLAVDFEVLMEKIIIPIIKKHYPKKKIVREGDKVCCPFHDDDDTPSLSIGKRRDNVLFHCFACENGDMDIFQFVAKQYGFSYKDNFPRVLGIMAKLLGIETVEIADASTESVITENRRGMHFKVMRNGTEFLERISEFVFNLKYVLQKSDDGGGFTREFHVEARRGDKVLETDMVLADTNDELLKATYGYLSFLPKASEGGIKTKLVLALRNHLLHKYDGKVVEVVELPHNGLVNNGLVLSDKVFISNTGTAISPMEMGWRLRATARENYYDINLEGEDNASKFFSYMFRSIPAERAAVLFGFFTAGVLRERFNAAKITSSQGLGGFPTLSVFGQRGCGKSTILQGLTKAFGVRSDHLMSTTFSNLTFLSTTNIPFIIDEVKRGTTNRHHLDALVAAIRKLYNEGTETRGTVAQTLKHYKLRAPLIVCGEESIGDIEPAVKERLCTMYIRKLSGRKEKLSPNEVKDLQTIPMGGFAYRFYKEILLMTTEDIIEKYEAALSLVANKGYGVVSPRIVHNLAVVLSGFLIFDEVCQRLSITLPSVDTELIVQAMVLDSDAGIETSHTKWFWEAFQEGILDGSLNYGYHYEWNDKNLYFRMKSIYKCYSTMEGTEKISLKALRKHLEEEGASEARKLMKSERSSHIQEIDRLGKSKRQVARVIKISKDLVPIKEICEPMSTGVKE